MRRYGVLLAALVVSAVLQTVIFPVVGPLPFWRAQLAWVALAPMLWVILQLAESTRRPLLRATLASYLCGVLWYGGHCYWILQTMHQYGGLSLPMAILSLVLFCCYLGLYHLVFGFMSAVLWRAWKERLTAWTLSVAFAALWVAVELARARVTSFPWDLLGYSQVDNATLASLAPWAGVYPISFLLAFSNAVLAITYLEWVRRGGTGQRATQSVRPVALILAGVFALIVMGALWQPRRPAADRTAVLVQPNLNLAQESVQAGSAPLEDELAQLSSAAAQGTRAARVDLILWPESPSPYQMQEPHLQHVVTTLAAEEHTTVILDSNAIDPDASSKRRYRLYNAAGLFTSTGQHGRYDKIRLVPFGEFLPYADLFSFAGGLTQQVGLFDRGTHRAPLSDGQHRYGVFICYESIFPEEVRQFTLRGAEVLVNLSDDGWYGDSSAPFQHGNMARMRAIENRRWLLRDTNNGITEVIDPYGNVRQSAPRNQRLAAAMNFAYSDTLTLYTRYGDWFAWLCVAATAAALAAAVARLSR